MADPLLGKKILIPRSKKQAASLSEEVTALGGIPVEIPLLSFRECPLPADMLSKCKKEDYYDWIIFTSSNGVRAFFHQLDGFENKVPKIAVIGEKTTKTLLTFGYQPEFIPSEYVAETFVEEFKPLLHNNEKILIVKGNLARDYLSTNLKKCNATIEEAIVYNTYFPKESEELLAKKLLEKELDILFFTSTSTVDHFMSVVEKYDLLKKISDCTVVCIGPVTKKRLDYYEIKVDVLPEVFTVDSMIAELVQYLKISR
ncbi:uroporphyrinogen-III synthase [Niallia sp. 01092]|uniref:uroporphyrinogen-III synthase n=1 Tax=unclassified Niallia TaxID=2837522 RepID=UPI003FCF6A73